MKIWITTDTHFGHKKLVELGVRPDGFEEQIYDNLIEKVKFNDVLIHLGDFCIGKDADWLDIYLEHDFARSHILVKGNHDNKTLSWYMDHGFDLACKTFTGRYFGYNILFSHIPRNLKNYPNIDYNIHGHFHEGDHRSSEPEIAAFYDPTRHIKLALEESNYQPWDLETLLKGKPKREYKKEAKTQEEDSNE